MSETQLAKIDPNRFLAINPNEDMRAAIAAAEDAGESFGVEDLIKVKTPAGGSTIWEIPTAGKPEQTEAIEGILVCWQPTGVLWPSDDPAPGTLPVLRTFNPTAPDAVAEQVGPIPDHMLDVLKPHLISAGPPATYSWAHLPHNQWGTGKKGVGKACKEQRVMFILREGDIAPLVIRAQPGSLRAVKDWFNKIRTSVGIPFYRCVVSLRLEKAVNKNGQAYSKIVPAVIGTIPSDVGAVIKEKYTDVLRHLVKEIEEDAGSDGSGE